MSVLEAANPTSSVPSLISDARRGDKSSIGALLQQYRNYLLVLASTQIENRLQPRVSPSDVVQETMLRAHKNFGQFRGTTEPELLAWLRQILVNNLAKFVEQHMLAARRDVRREVSIERLGAALEQSTMQLAALAARRRQIAEHGRPAARGSGAAGRSAGAASHDYREVLVLAQLAGAAVRRSRPADRPLGRRDADAVAAGDRKAARGLRERGTTVRPEFEHPESTDRRAAGSGAGSARADSRRLSRRGRAGLADQPGRAARAASGRRRRTCAAT